MFILQHDPKWVDPDSSWQMKLDRAQDLITELSAAAKAFRGDKPIKVVADEAPVDGKLAYRVRRGLPVPNKIRSLVSDVVNNLRASMDNLAFEMAKISQSGNLTKAQEAASQFPVCVTPDEFAEFFNARKARRTLYSQQARDAFRLVQPFKELEDLDALGVPRDTTFEEHARFDELYRIDNVVNVEKHRHKSDLNWLPDVIYWGATNGPSKRTLTWADRTMQDGSVLFHIEGHDEGMGNELSQEWILCLANDPAFPGSEGVKHDVVQTMDLWQQRLRHAVFPKIYTAMSRPAPDDAVATG